MLPVRIVCSSLLALLLVAGCAPDAPDPVDHGTALRRLAAQLQAGQDEAAETDLVAYLASAPHDEGMHYNLACLQSRRGDLDGALRSIERALADGYQRLTQLQTDPDLAPLHDDPRLAALLATHQEQLRAESQAASSSLVGEAWSEPMPLDTGHTTRIRLGVEALQVDVGKADDLQQIWIVLAIPDDPEASQGTRWFEFHLQRQGQQWITSPDLVTLDQGVVSVPWSAMQPHRPPLDLLFGWNVVLETADHRPALLDDPHIGRSDRPWRRFALLSTDPGDDPPAALVARPDTRLVVGDTLSLELGLQGVPDGMVPVSLSSDDGAGAEVTVAVDFGLGYGSAMLMSEGAETGWVTITAHAPEHDLRWQGRVFRLTSDWFRQQHERLGSLPTLEQTLVQFWLFRVLRGQQSFDPRDDPTDLASAVERVETLMQRHADHGSVFPVDACTEPVAIRSGRDSLVKAGISLPEAGRRGDALSARLVLVDRSDELDPALDSEAYAEDVVLVVPVPPVPGSDAVTVAQVEAARQWLTDLLPGVRTPTLEGRGMAANSAVLAAVSAPEHWAGLDLRVDHRFDPWPVISAEDLPSQVSAELRNLIGDVVRSERAGRRAGAALQALGVQE